MKKKQNQNLKLKLEDKQGLLLKKIADINKKFLVKKKLKKWKLTGIDMIKVINFKANKENIMIGMNLMMNANNLCLNL